MSKPLDSADKNLATCIFSIPTSLPPSDRSMNGRFHSQIPFVTGSSLCAQFPPCNVCDDFSQPLSLPFYKYSIITANANHNIFMVNKSGSLNYVIGLHRLSKFDVQPLTQNYQNKLILFFFHQRSLKLPNTPKCMKHLYEICREFRSRLNAVGSNVEYSSLLSLS